MQLVLRRDFGTEARWLEAGSDNTRESAGNTARLLSGQGVRRVVLVTHAWHMPRSVALFEAQGCQVIPYPVDYTITRAGWDALWHPDWQSVAVNILPGSGSLALTTNVMKEYIGMVVYWLRGMI